MKSLLFLAAMVFCSCTDDGDFINHTLQAEKAGNCNAATGKYRMVSNTSGERYIFDLCLANTYNGKDHTRNGDTIMVSFPTITSGEASALYKITLDIDAKPRYNFIKLDDKLIAVLPGNY
jgi:hypothetical protein